MMRDEWDKNPESLRSLAINAETKSQCVSWMRPAMEATLALVILAIAWPLFILIGILIRWDSPGPILYRQVRVGYGGRHFTMLKFRSMREDAEALSGPTISTAFDPRVTRIGRWLRNLHLDELPQILHVLRGEMSWVGPRPERPIFVAALSEKLPHYSERHRVRPGLTGLAQISLPYDASGPEKLTYDLAYVARANELQLNLSIVILTFKKLLHVRFNQSVSPELNPSVPRMKT